jgi:glycosyltransferase involved in cell wall biosynthesis
MVEALETMAPVSGERPVRLLVCAPNSTRSLDAIGIRGERVEKRTIDTQAAIRLQQEADLLYLPLAFETPWRDEIRTVFPTKAVEYLVSGTPILLHAPGDSYTALEARKLGWAHVVDTLEPIDLQRAVQRLLRDQPLREKLVENARAAARLRDARKIAAGLQKDLGLA